MTMVIAICVAVTFGVSIYLMLGRELKGIAMGVFLMGHAANQMPGSLGLLYQTLVAADAHRPVGGQHLDNQVQFVIVHIGRDHVIQCQRIPMRQLPLRRAHGQRRAARDGRHHHLPNLGRVNKKTVKRLTNDLLSRAHQQQFSRRVNVLDNQRVVQLYDSRELVIDQLAKKMRVSHMRFPVHRVAMEVSKQTLNWVSGESAVACPVVL